MTESVERRDFICLTEKLFEGVVAMYSSRFRTSTIVKRVLDAMDSLEVFEDNDEVLNTLKAAWTARNDFCKLRISITPSNSKRHDLTIQ